MPGQIEQLKGYAVAAEPELVEHQAHKIKGAAATVGGEVLRAVASAVEQAAKARDLAVIATRMAELDAQFAALKESMKNDA